MLHIFHVDRGQMLTLDIQFAMQTVRNLQSAIRQITSVPENKQILMISGGDVLDSAQRVTKYSGAGTETNPIFLIMKNPSDLSQSKNGSESSFLGESYSSFSMQETEQMYRTAVQQRPGLDAVRQNAAIARQIANFAANDAMVSEALVKDQHWLQQAWFAMVANLDEIAKSFDQRSVAFRNSYAKYLERRQLAVDILAHFSDDLEILKQIPLVPTLLVPGAASGAALDDSSEVTLFSWISQVDPEHSLTDLADDAERSLGNFREDLLKNIDEQKQIALSEVAKDSMREIKGLSQRLQQLDQLLAKVRDFHESLETLAESLKKQEQSAMGTTKDFNVFSGIQQMQNETLRQMVTQYKPLWDICSRFHKAKAELLRNIRSRITWISQCQVLISNQDGKLVIFREQLIRLKHQIDLIRQIHDAPRVYALAVSEVVRRRGFSQEFIDYTGKLATQMRALYGEESELRLKLNDHLHRHFLRALFPGLNDPVPEFALKAPPPFDQNLPPVDANEIRQLKQKAPLIAEDLKVYENASVYEKLFIRKPEKFDRKASFYVSTPPKSLALAKSMPSSSWLGEEFASPVQASPLKDLPRRITEADEPAAAMEKDQIAELPSPTANGAKIAQKSAPIRIPSRTSEGLPSRQLSERSSRFGTPEEGGTGGEQQPEDDEDAAVPVCFSLGSPPEVITQSQLREICAAAEEIANSGDQAAAAEQIANSGDPAAAKEIVNSGEPAAKKLPKILPVVDLKGMRKELEELRNLVENLAKFGRDEAKNAQDVVKRAVQTLEKNLQFDLAEFQRANEEIQRAEFDGKEAKLRQEFDVVEQKLRDSDKQNGLLQAYCNQKDDEADILREKLQNLEKETAGKFEQEKAVYLMRCEEERHDIMKRATIDHELQLDAMRKDHEAELADRDMTIEKLERDVAERESVMKHMRVEQDRLLASIYDRETSMSGEIETIAEERKHEFLENLVAESEAKLAAAQIDFDDRLRKENEQLKAELEASYRDKMTFLTQGLEDKHRQALERFAAEKDFEIRRLKERVKLLEEEAAAGAGATAPQVVEEQKQQQSAVATASDQLALSTVTLMEASVAAEPESLQSPRVSTPVPHQPLPVGSQRGDLLPPASAGSQRSDLVSVVRVSIGDNAFVFFDPKYRNYVVLTLSSILHFVAHCSLPNLGLELPKEGEMAPPKTWTVVKITKKDYCMSKKDRNRFQIPKGTKFYLIEAEKFQPLVAKAK